MYLDWVEAYSDDNVVKKAKKDKVDPVEEIIYFVEDIKNFGGKLDPGFIVIAQNAAELAGYGDYVDTIDAIAQEQVWFDGSAEGKPEGDCPLPATDDDIETDEYVRSLSPGCRKMHDTLTESTLHVSSEEYIHDLKAAQRKGLPVFTVDYALKEKNINSVFKTSKGLGFVPFTSNRPLSEFVEPK